MNTFFSFRLTYYSFKQFFFTKKRLNEGFHLNARIPSNRFVSVWFVAKGRW